MVVISERVAARVIIVVIPECRSRESVFAVVVLFLNDRSPTKFLGDDKQRDIAVIPECRSRESAVCRCGFLTKRQIPEPCGAQNLTERRKEGMIPAK